MAIADLSFIEKYFHFTEIGSTNTFAKGLAAFPATGIFVVHADNQTHGRGQREKSFFSDNGGLYATIVCPIPNIENHFVLNRALSLALCDSIGEAAPYAALFIKWPNDIYWNDKKLCGILLESIAGSPRHIAIGFGLNVNIDGERFPQELKNGATSMFSETGERFDAETLLTDICSRFQKYRCMDPLLAHEYYCKKLFNVGMQVMINGERGIFKSVLSDGRLCLEGIEITSFHSSGSLCFLSA